MQDNKTKKGKKLFGIFTVIDVIFILIVIAAVVFFFMKRSGTKVETKSFVIGFYSEEVSDFVADNLKVGARVVGDSDFDDLGEIIDIDLFDAVSYGNDAKGQIQLTSKPGYKAAVIYCKVNGQSNGYGLYINGHTYAPGHSFTFYSANAKLYLRVFSLQEITEYDANGAPVFEKPDIFKPLEDMKYAETSINGGIPAISAAEETEAAETEALADKAA